MPRTHYLREISAIAARGFLRDIKILIVTSRAIQAVRKFLTAKSEIVVSPSCLNLLTYYYSSGLLITNTTTEEGGTT
jgi:hypothetical protein